MNQAKCVTIGMETKDKLTRRRNNKKQATTKKMN